MMQYAKGSLSGRLHAFAKAKRTPPQYEAVRVMADICAGMAYVHAEGWLHLDLKPENILLDGDRRALLTDFSLAQRHTESGILTQAGTPPYRSPELRDPHGRVGMGADAWAAGLIMVQILKHHYGLDYSIPFDLDTSSTHLRGTVSPTATTWLPHITLW